MWTKSNIFNVPYCVECPFYSDNPDRGETCALNGKFTYNGVQCEVDHTALTPRQISKALHIIRKNRNKATKRTIPQYVIDVVDDAILFQLRNIKE